MEEVCSICLENLEDHIQLNCKHLLHPNCLRILARNKPNPKCPLCRVEILPEIISEVDNNNVCTLCNQNISNDETDMNFVRIEKCGCHLHYTCWKQYIQSKFPFEKDGANILPLNSEVSCPKCNVLTTYYKVEGKDYGYLKDCHETFIGEIHCCLHKYCIYNANPQRYGYCQIHAKRKASNRAIKRTLEFMCKYGSIWSQEKIEKLFYKVLRIIEDKLEMDYDMDISTHGIEICNQL